MYRWPFIGCDAHGYASKTPTVVSVGANSTGCHEFGRLETGTLHPGLSSFILNLGKLAECINELWE